MIDVKLCLLYSNTWNHLTVYKQNELRLVKNIIDKFYLQIIYIFFCFFRSVCVCVCVCKPDLTLNNQQRLVCHKTKPNLTHLLVIL